jgi:hypothetical protein
VIYRTPDVKPVYVEVAEGDPVAGKAVEQRLKGQGEFELPSAVYLAHGVKNLCVSFIEC